VPSGVLCRLRPFPGEDTPVRIILPITLAASLLASTALGQDTRKDDLANEPNVQQSQPPDPAPQGTRAPDAQNTETESMSLDDALAAVRRAPPNLEGAPVPRPNQMASEPDDPGEPSRSSNPSDLTTEDNVGGQ
jgi:hypothetical protein